MADEEQPGSIVAPANERGPLAARRQLQRERTPAATPGACDDCSSLQRSLPLHERAEGSRAWAGLHTKPGQSRARPLRAPKRVLPGTLILVEVSRLPGRTRTPQVLWLAGAEATRHGPGQPNLTVVWRASVRRFDLEHTFRFVKQIVNGTTPRVRHPAQADRWSWLVAAVSTDLRLARPVAGDRRVPWERPLPVATLTPYRVRRAFPQLMATLGTPAVPPKPCGRSPGRPKGTCSGPAPHSPALKRTT